MMTGNVERLSRLQILLWLLAIIQLIIILILFFSWPKPLVKFTVVLPAHDLRVWSSLINDFQKKNPRIRIDPVQTELTTDQVLSLYTSSFQTGNSPYDLVYMDIIWVPKFAEQGWLMDLSDLISPKERADFLKDDLEAGQYQGRLYRIPFHSDVGMLFYRKDLLDKYGKQPPDTFDQLKQITKELQQHNKNLNGFLWQGKNSEGLVAFFLEILKGHGGFWVNPATLEVGLDLPAAIQSVEFLRSTIAEGISPEDVRVYNEQGSLQRFQDGQAIFMRNWPNVWVLLNNKDSPIRGQIGIKSMIHAPGKSSGTCKGGWGWGIAKSTKYQEEARKVIKFFTSIETQRKFILETGVPPSRRSLFDDQKIVKKYPYFPQLLPVVENAALRPPIPQYNQISDILRKHLSEALNVKGPMSSKQAMEAAARETRNLLRHS